MSKRYNEFGKPSSANLRKLHELLRKNDNRVCADCGAPDPKWASANIGVFLCTKCSSIHRSLGPDISKVMSVTLDPWGDDDIDSMVEVGGNSSANSIYEAFLPKGVSKPKQNASNEERTNFIRSKYELQEFLKPSLRMVSSKSSFKSCDSRKDLDIVFDSRSSRKEPGVDEIIGTLKVKVVKGTDLAVRDMLSSDPYVILTLGDQKVRTTVIKSNLNPVWNEELEMSVPHRYRPLKLRVFDHDLFSADDIMGEAEIDLQPLLTAAMAFGDPQFLGDMQIGKWLKSNDNALIKDSIINVVDGRVKQEVSLKLQNVESGEIELELEWVPINQ
ncbi:putative Arf GTPase activating protein [Dioscorea sansibarensis]